MREKVIEQKLASEVLKRGGICPKWVSPSFSGVPDRLVFLPNGKFGLVEVKAPNQHPRALQVSRHKLFEHLGFRVYVLDNKKDIKGILDEIETAGLSRSHQRLHHKNSLCSSHFRHGDGKNSYHLVSD